MNEPAAVTISLRIPGQWSGPRDLVEHLPAGYRLTPEALIMPDESRIAFGAARADDQFSHIFRSSCREQPTDDELAAIDAYKVNVFLEGAGGSLEAAQKMMQAAVAILDAGGAGVFIDNCVLAHGGQNWRAMTDDGGPDAISFAFVGIVRGKTEVWTMGMHVLGLSDVVMKRSDIETGGYDIVEVVRYMARGAKPMGDGHILTDLDGPRFQAFAQDCPNELAGSPMYNPFGRLKLVGMQDIAEAN